MTNKFAGFPVNVPYYWKVVLRAPSDVSAFVNASNEAYEDLFYDITNFYYNANLGSAQAFRRHLVRMLTVKTLPLETYAALPSDEYRKHFKDAGFLVPHNFVTASDPKYPSYLAGSYSQHDMNAETTGIVSLTDSPDHPMVSFKEDIDFTVTEGAITFVTYPFAPVSGRTPPYWQESYTAPWGDTYTVNVIRFLANEVALTESPLYDGFGGLVYNQAPTVDDDEAVYRNKILGLFLLFYRGATPHAVDACLNLLLGMPVTLHQNEVVFDIRPAYFPDGSPDPDHQEVRTDRESYIARTDIPLNEQVVIGNTLPKFSPLNAAVEVHMNTDAHNWINGVTLPTRYLCVMNLATGSEDAVTIDTDTLIKQQYSSEADLDGALGRVVALGYDTPRQEALASPGAINPDVHTRNKYLWDALFSQVVFKIKFNVVVDLEIISFVDTILHDVMPIWTTYLLEYINEEGEPTMFMAGEYMDKEYSSSFLD